MRPVGSLGGGGAGLTYGTARVVHPAIRRLPPPGSGGGLSQVVFRAEEGDEAGEEADANEPRHQAAEPFLPPPRAAEEGAGGGGGPCEDAPRPAPPEFQPPKGLPSYSKEQLREWKYPEYDPRFGDPEWLKEQFQRERDDPRENANFFLQPSDPEFFHNITRRPYARALVRSEEHWNHRKNQWLEQFENVLEQNEGRELVGERLEQCSAEVKRLVTPMLQHRLVAVYLMDVEQKARQRGVPFELQIETDEVRGALEEFRRTADSPGGGRAMEDMFRAWDFRCSMLQRDKLAKDEQDTRLKGGRVGTMEELKDALNEGAKCKVDGILEWNKGNVEEAITSWRQAHRALCKVRAPDVHASENQAKDELHLAVLKNLAQAAIKLGNWNEALQAADLAVEIDDQDHKAWFRRACALEGLGRYGEVEDCLRRIDDIAVGRPDRDRIEKDTQAKRDKVKALCVRDEASQRRMLQGGVKHAIFSEERDTAAPLPERPGPPAISHKVEVVSVDDATRRRLTKDGAEDMLRELKAAYGDPTFRKQVRKLAQDVNDQGEFIAYLNRVALSVQGPVLRRFGFPGTDVGVAEMKRAIADHTRPKDADPKLRLLAEETMQALYGDFYQVARGVGLLPEHRAPDRPRTSRRRAEDKGSESEPEACAAETPPPPPCLHWTGRPKLYELMLAAAEDKAARQRAAASGAAGRLEARRAQEASRPKITALDRKEIWAELSRCMEEEDAGALRKATERAVEAGFSAITIRSAKKRISALGGDVDGLP